MIVDLAEKQNAVALAVACPFCGAVEGQQCEDGHFPQYPHLERLDKAEQLTRWDT